MGRKFGLRNNEKVGKILAVYFPGQDPANAPAKYIKPMMSLAKSLADND